MRGISLPIETIVIIAVTILVLVIVTSFFILQSGKSIVSITDDAALAQGCTELASRYFCDTNPTLLSQIKISSYETTSCSGVGSDCFVKQGICNCLLAACIKKGFTTVDACRKTACRCPS